MCVVTIERSESPTVNVVHRRVESLRFEISNILGSTWLKEFHPPTHPPTPHTHVRGTISHSYWYHTSFYHTIICHFLMCSIELHLYYFIWVSPITIWSWQWLQRSSVHNLLPRSFSSVCWRHRFHKASRRSSSIHRWAHRGKIEWVALAAEFDVVKLSMCLGP